MKNNRNRYLLVVPLVFLCTYSSAQCPIGSSTAELNWDHIDFLPSNNTRYTSFYPSLAFPYSQNFMLATRKLNMTMAPQAAITLNGENATNTAHAGSFATAGDDVQFTTTSNNATVQFTFDADVNALSFSLFDIDADQRVTITAQNAGGTDQVVVITNANAGSAITVTGSGTIAAAATAPATSYPSNDNMGTINIHINTPLNRVTIAFSNAAGDVWLSDVTACVTG